jgi:hypothetical protein
VADAVGAPFFVEPFATLDIGFLLNLPSSENLLVSLEPIHAWLRMRDYSEFDSDRFLDLVHRFGLQEKWAQSFAHFRSSIEQPKVAQNAKKPPENRRNCGSDAGWQKMKRSTFMLNRPRTKS